jgi:pilus assembly protein Flp/PilA
MAFLCSRGRNSSGASAAEYALILAIIGTGIAAAAFALGDSIADSFRAVAVQFAS